MTDAPEDDAIAKALARKTCPHCGAVLSRHQAISPGHCGAPDCMARHLAQAAEQREVDRAAEFVARRQEVTAQVPAALARAAAALEVEPEALTVAVLPYQNRPVTPTPDATRARFEEHLDAILSRVFNEPDTVMTMAPRSNPAPEPEIVDVACAACQGFCCLRGGGDNHAFLTAQTLLQVVETDPELTPEALREVYVSALPEASVEGSCVYHGAAGCTLPRSHRAALCNRFHCHEIHALHDQTGGRADLPIAMVGQGDGPPRKIIAYDATRGGVRGVEILEPAQRTVP